VFRMECEDTCGEDRVHTTVVVDDVVRFEKGSVVNSVKVMHVVSALICEVVREGM
jgi:hypothetical protein